MQVNDVMTRNPCVINADDSVLTAAQALADNAIGGLPVADGDRLLGMLTDRDIVVRAIARNLNPVDTLVQEIVSGQPRYCFEDEDTEDVARNMDERWYGVCQ